MKKKIKIYELINFNNKRKGQEGRRLAWEEPKHQYKTSLGWQAKCSEL